MKGFKTKCQHKGVHKLSRRTSAHGVLKNTAEARSLWPVAQAAWYAQLLCAGCNVPPCVASNHQTTSAHGVLKNTTEALSHLNEPRRALTSLISSVADVGDSLVVAAAWRCRRCRAWRRGEKRLIEPMAVMTTM